MKTILPPVSPQQAGWAAQKWPDMTEMKLVEARNLFANRCSGCHKLVLPSKNSLEKWEIVLNKMAPKAKLNQDQKELLWRYLVAVKYSPN